MPSEAIDVQKRKLELLQSQKRLRTNLPHLYGWKNYPWMREFIECTNKTAFLTAANQIGKSSSQIRKLIQWATDKTLWPMLWPGRTPRVFWYLYPSREVATAEFDTKWIPDFMPKNEMKAHPIYGWVEQRNSKKQIEWVKFNTGVFLYFKTYSQDSDVLQTASVDYVACDEELPAELWDEVNFRRNATDGYFSMVFTSTRGEDLWRQTMEPSEEEKKNGRVKFPHAWKKQISLFDCRFYEDGTRSHWSDDKIKRTIAMCASESDVQRRVYGRFVVSGGRKYSSFDRSRNVIAPGAIPHDWIKVVGVDIGSGTTTSRVTEKKRNHPSTISFIAVKPDYTYGVVYKHWRSDIDENGTEMAEEHSSRITAGDTANQYIKMAGRQTIQRKFYDFHAVDFKTITDRMYLGFEPAEKGQSIGETLLNTLFKNKMLMIFDLPECEPIINEFSSLLRETDKRNAKDDSADSVRYGATKLIWNFDAVKLELQPLPELSDEKLTPYEIADLDRDKHRATMFKKPEDDFQNSITDALDSWSEFEDY